MSAAKALHELWKKVEISKGNGKVYNVCTYCRIPWQGKFASGSHALQRLDVIEERKHRWIRWDPVLQERHSLFV
jgi:hypothetical protein